MIALSLNRSWQQLLHPKFRGVMLTAVGAAAATLVILTIDLLHNRLFSVQDGNEKLGSMAL